MSDYYLILGLERDAEPEKIKHAYRFYCKKYHPDISSTKEKKKFLEIQEAYETLSNKEKRRLYDQSLNNRSEQIPVNIVDTGFRQEWSDENHGKKKYSSLSQEYFDSFFAGLFKENLSEAEELSLELILSPQEALRGGDFTIEVPVREECSVCLGQGYLQRFICSFCGGSGIIHKKRSFDLHVPPKISSGTRYQVALSEKVNINVEIIVG